ncbi:MAG: hypothetical protein NW237_01565 [Cyanobacteriota bacterium]|nr:hypothetical protein [Cyanobacteriota bacterium]
MSIQQIIQEVFASAHLTEAQEDAINTILWDHRFSEQDIDALDRLIEAILRKEVRANDYTLRNETSAA